MKPDALPPNAGQRALARKRAAGKLKAYRVDPITCDRDYTADEVEFMLAMQEYKRANNRPFPTWSETLGVLKALGYRKATPDR